MVREYICEYFIRSSSAKGSSFENLLNLYLSIELLIDVKLEYGFIHTLFLGLAICELRFFFFFLKNDWLAKI